MRTLLPTLAERGLLQDATPGLAERLGQGAPVTAYAGFDPTADSLHVGNLVPVMGLAWLQRCGGRPIVLVGGGTAMVGDPSGKRAERPVLPRETIEANAAAIRAQLARFLDFHGTHAAKLVNNADWLGDLFLLDFLRDTGKHFTVNYMLQKEAVKTRLETGISFTEFSYMLLQAHDYWHLALTEGCELQLGGSDQWGNMTAGIELIHRREGRTAHALSFPLLTAANGQKFGKSEQGNVWLDPAKTSPYQFFQFWLNQDDADVERLLRLFTFLPLEHVAVAMLAQLKAPGERAAQRLLAEEVTRMVHGDAATRGVIAASQLLFGSGDIRAADPAAFAVLEGELPVHRVPRSSLAEGLPLLDALVAAGLAPSKGEARRLVQQRGYSVNGEPQDDAGRRITADDLLAGRYSVLQRGKKTYALLVAEG